MMPLATLTPQAAGSTPIVFEVSEDRIRTWREARLTGTARYAVHEVQGDIPKREFLGPGAAELTLAIHMDAARGLAIEDELSLLRTYRDTGEVVTFVQGGVLVSDFVLLTVEEEWKRTDVNGKLTAAMVTLTLGEYA